MKILNNSIPQSAPRSKAPSLAELLCFALLCVGLMVLMVPTAQRRHTVVPVAPRQGVEVVAATVPAVAKKNAWAFNWTRPRFAVH